VGGGEGDGPLGGDVGDPSGGGSDRRRGGRGLVVYVHFGESGIEDGNPQPVGKKSGPEDYPSYLMLKQKIKVI